MSDADPFAPHRDGVLLQLVVQPRASRNELADVHAGALRLRITAPPVDGAANVAIVEFLARQLGVAKSDVELVSGQARRRKRVLVRGLAADAARERLGLQAHATTPR